jgi:hypothetical protein
VEGDIEGMPSGSFEPGGKSAEFVVLFQEENAVPCATEDVGRGHPCQAGTDHYNVVFGLEACEKVFWHCKERRAGRIEG